MTDEKIDFVIAWVDGNDKAWQAEKANCRKSSMPNSDTAVRFRDWDNLQYWFRGVEKFASWVNQIYFITWGHLPKWLNQNHEKLKIIHHKDYIPEKYLPTFNANTIELNFHRIPTLSEKFVYFNDDMFIVRKMQPEDFFRKNLPCDCFGLNGIYFGPDTAGHFNGSDLEIINTEFKNKKAIMKRDFFKWYSPKNGLKNNIKTILLSSWDWFPGFHYNHLPTSLLKTSLEEIWEKYGSVLDKTCSCQFREESNVNQWLIKYWQFCQGNYIPRSDKIGKCFHIEESNFQELCDALEYQKYALICINDTSRTVNFEEKKKKVKEHFEKILPEKSSFEV